MCQPIKLRIKNFGPVKEGSFRFDKYTVLIGRQGTGKSTVAKLFSLFIWIEKQLIRHALTERQLTQGAFRNRDWNKYHRIADYYKAETELEYDGLHYRFVYSDEQLQVTAKESQGIEVAKVMYVPAERNILSAIEKPANISGWPESLSAFLEEFEKSKQQLQTLRMPLHDALRFEYDRLNKISWIAGEGFRTRLAEASSGYQSLVPLCLVTAYLSARVEKAAGTALSVADKLKLQKEVSEVMANRSLSEEVRNAMLQNISARFSYGAFVNVVEEMEQNLYPHSQKDILYFLLSECNRMDGNRLVLTTHSPYLLSYLSLATKAQRLWEKLSADDTPLAQRLAAIVPRAAAADLQKLHIYELDGDGHAHELAHAGDIPSDNNYLNNLLEETNALYNDLLDIEEDG